MVHLQIFYCVAIKHLFSVISFVMQVIKFRISLLCCLFDCLFVFFLQYFYDIFRPSGLKENYTALNATAALEHLISFMEYNVTVESL